MQSLAKLKDTYNVMVAVYDAFTPPLLESGEALAKGLTDVQRYLEGLSASKGLPACKTLRVVGHSFGGAAAQLMLRTLASQGAIGEGSGKSFNKVVNVPIDTPFRGIDAPPGAVQAAAGMVPPAMLSLANDSASMEALRQTQLPPEVVTDVVQVRGMSDPQLGLKNPLDNLHSSELAPGELEHLFGWLRADTQDVAALRYPALGGAVEARSLENLVAALLRDKDGPATLKQLAEEAKTCATAEEFQPKLDAALEKAVEFFTGDHTGFMWTAPEFLPALRQHLTTG